MIERKLLLALFVFLVLAILYQLTYLPVIFLHGTKIYNTGFTQADVSTYAGWAQREILNRPFWEWSMRVESYNLSLLYFSWLFGLFSQLPFYDVFATSVLLVGVFLMIHKILKDEGCDSLFSSYAMVTFFPLVLYMQTLTKEIVILFLFCTIFLAFPKKKVFIILGAVALLFLVRFYFAMTIILALLCYFNGHRIGKKIFFLFFFFLTFVLPFGYARIFSNFLIQGQTEMGLSNYYMLSVKYPGMFILWMPLRLFQNIIEPIVNFLHFSLGKAIFDPSLLFDFLSSLSICSLVLVIFLYRRVIKKTSGFTLFLLIFTGFYLLMIASIPIIHFRYIVLLLPVLGMLADMLRKEIVGQI